MLAVNHRKNYVVTEVTVRIVLVVIFLISDTVEPFHRKIQPEELYLYRYPNESSYVTLRMLLLFVTVTPILVFGTVSFLQRDKTDLLQGGLGLSLALAIDGAVTNLIKVSVGRPRPNYLWRCYPDGQFDMDKPCWGNPIEVTDGIKSFPSGHSSIAFSVLGFLSLYLASKLQCFTAQNGSRGQSWRLCLAMLPLVIAGGVAISRTCDYHHHWQDVVVGAILGMLIASVCYNQYFQGPVVAPHCSHCSALLPLTPSHRSGFHADDNSALITVKSV